MTTHLHAALAARLQQQPLIAILRGLTPAEAPDVGDALVAAGFTLLEVPLNSPRALDSIALLRARFPQVAVGAGTVLSAQAVREVHAAGGQLIVAPNFDAAVVAEATRLGLTSLPGILTPTEAFAALAAGATALKLFPAEAASPTVMKAMRAVLPSDTLMLPVGGVTHQNMAGWLAVGAAGFGIGSALYKPGQSAQAVRQAADAFVAAAAAARATLKG